MRLGTLLRKAARFLLFLSTGYFISYGINYKVGDSMLGALLSIFADIILFMMLYYPLFFPRRFYAVCLVSIVLLVYNMWVAILVIIVSLLNLVGWHNLVNIILFIKHVLQRIKGEWRFGKRV